jgi:hypothetical protein
MTVYRIELVKSPGITDAECKRRLARAYDLILSWNDRDTADLDAIEDQDQVGGNTPDAEGQEVTL